MSSLYRTLVIGLGGSGHRAAFQIRKLLTDRLVELGWPDHFYLTRAWQFLVLDVTSQELSLGTADEDKRTITDSFWNSPDDYRNLGLPPGNGDYSSWVALSRLGSDEFLRRFPDLAAVVRMPIDLRPYRVAPRVRRQAAQFFAFVYRQSLKADLVKRLEMLKGSDSEFDIYRLQRMMGLPDVESGHHRVRIFVIGSSIGATGSVLMLELLELLQQAYRTVHGEACLPTLVVFPSDAFGFMSLSGHFRSPELENEGVFLSRLASLHQFDTPANKRPYDIYFQPRPSLADFGTETGSDGREAIAVASEYITSVSMSPFYSSQFDHFRQDWQSKRLIWAETLAVSSFGLVKVAIGRRHLATYFKELIVRRLFETSDSWAPSAIARDRIRDLERRQAYSLGLDHFTKVLADSKAPLPKRLLPMEHEYLLEEPELWPELARMLLQRSCTQSETSTANLLDAVSREIIEGGFPISTQPDDLASPFDISSPLWLNSLNRQVESWLMRPGSATQRYLTEGLRSYLDGDPLLYGSSRNDQIATRRKTFREKFQQALEFLMGQNYYWRTQVHPHSSPWFVFGMSALPAGLPSETLSQLTDISRAYGLLPFEGPVSLTQRDTDTEWITIQSILNTLATPKLRQQPPDLA
jgi:hypothetical protein